MNSTRPPRPAGSPGDAHRPAGVSEPADPTPPVGPTEPPPAARSVFADRLDLAVRYSGWLADAGVVRGLIGPREAPRLWDRHLLNCAVLAELIESGASVLDVGSGAGLPGIVLAVARPDLSVVLVEPLARRSDFLAEVVAALGLADQIQVVRSRAEEYPGPPADIVTARAVAPLDRLAGWCLPLARPHGRLLALKGGSAADEIAEHTAAVARLGGGTPLLRTCGVGLVDPPTTVVEIVRERDVVGSGKGANARGGGARGRARRR
jgi:16S rRNA (guanine527-N7)-methyltransferase